MTNLYKHQVCFRYENGEDADVEFDARHWLRGNTTADEPYIIRYGIKHIQYFFKNDTDLTMFMLMFGDRFKPMEKE